MTGPEPASTASARTGANPIVAWALTAAWALGVWGLGGDDLSLEGTSRFLVPMIHWLFPGISEATSDLLQYAIRKAAHVTEYGILAFLTFRAGVASGWPALPRTTLVSIGLAVAFAAADETRQSLSATRLGSVWDVVLDACGALGVVGLLLWIREAQPRFGHWLGLCELPTSAPSDGAATGPPT